MARADLHCHSSASQVSKLGVQRALGLPECATPPQAVYELAKRRGMDFVTITDHDTIDGVLEIADRPDVFISVELTAQFRGEPQAVHVLCFGISPDDHEWLQAHAGDVELVAEYLREHEIACALAHPFYAVGAPLAGRHRRRLADLFDAWEVRNGARARELNQPAAVYVETRGGTGVGGSDDHAGVDVGRTWSETPAASRPEELLRHVRAGRVHAGGDHGSAAKWAHAALAIAVRTLGRAGPDGRPDPGAVMRIVERVMAEGDARTGVTSPDLGPDDARALLRAWLIAVELDLEEGELLAHLQADGFRHGDLARRARRSHERRLRDAVAHVLAEAVRTEPDWSGAAAAVFDACIAAVPYVPATAFLGREKAKLTGDHGGPARVALVVDGIGSVHGVTRTVQEIANRGVPGFEVEVIGTDAAVDRRLSAVAEVALPFVPDVTVGVPSLPAVVEALTERPYDLLHLCTPGPVGIVSALTGQVLGLPACGSYHTELGAYAGLRSDDPRIAGVIDGLVAAFYAHCPVVLSPSAASDRRLRELGIDAERVLRWDRGVDLARFSPERRVEGRFGPRDRITVLYAGRVTREKGVGLLADAFLAARDPRLHLVVAGGGPEEAVLRERLGERVSFLGWLDGDELAVAYASADLFLFCSQTDTFGQVLLEAQASGLPVVAVGAGGPAELIADGRTGLLCPPEPEALGAALRRLAGAPATRHRLGREAATAVSARTWDRALERLAAGWHRALSASDTAARRAAG